MGYCGLKTGHTPFAGGCLVTHFKNYDYTVYVHFDLVLIVLGSYDNESRFEDTEKLLNWAIENIRKNERLLF